MSLAKGKVTTAPAVRAMRPKERGGAAGKKRSPGDSGAAAFAPNDARDAFRVQSVRSTADFAALKQPWSDLLARCQDANVFMSHEWLYAWWTSYQPDATLHIVVVEAGSRIVGIAPMMIERQRRAGVACRVLRFIGDGSSETDHIDFLVAAPDETSDTADAAIRRRLLNALAGLQWDAAEFNQIPETSPTVAALHAWIGQLRLPRTVSVSPCPVRRMPASFEALLATLPSRLRTSVRSARRRLAEAHRLDFGLHDRADELDAALSALFANHASRWQRKGQPGVFTDLRKRAFYEQLTPRLLERGWLRFFYLKLDGRIVAQQYCFALDRTVMLLQEGFDSTHEKDNVGNTLRSFVFEFLIEQRASCYDFLAGSSRHKASWSDDIVNDLRIACARRSLRGFLYFDVPQALERAKDRLRPLRDWFRQVVGASGRERLKR